MSPQLIKNPKAATRTKMYDSYVPLIYIEEELASTPIHLICKAAEIGMRSYEQIKALPKFSCESVFLISGTSLILF